MDRQPPGVPRPRLDEEASDAARSAWKGDHVFKKDAALGKLLRMVELGELRPPLMLIVEALDRLTTKTRGRRTIE